MRVNGSLTVAGTLLLLGMVAVTASAQEGGDPQRGSRLYVENCAVCHGEDGRGRVGANLTQFPGIEVSAALEQAIAEGVPGSTMPAWSQPRGGPLSDQDIADLVAYVEGVFAGTEPIAPLPTYVAPVIPPLADVSGDPSDGAVVYLENCAVCHGMEGRGRIGQTLAKSWPGNQPRVYIAQVVSDGISGTTMPAWRQDRGGPLSESEVADVTAYVLTLAPSPQPTPTAPAEGPIGMTTALIILGVLLLLAILIGLVYYRRA